jgi:SAM-dependent methyltransferase
MPPPQLTPLATAVLRVPPPERALVLGAPLADAVLFLAREFPGARVRGADRSADTVREAVERLGLDPAGRVAFKRYGGRALPYPDDFFDLVVVQGAGPPLVQLARVLRTGGHLLLVRGWRPGSAGRARDALTRRRLHHRGFEPMEDERAGDGNFLIARFPARDRATPGD